MVPSFSCTGLPKVVVRSSEEVPLPVSGMSEGATGEPNPIPVSYAVVAVAALHLRSIRCERFLGRDLSIIRGPRATGHEITLDPTTALCMSPWSVTDLSALVTGGTVIAADSWKERVRRAWRDNEEVNFGDGLVGCSIPGTKYIATSPNSKYIPVPIIGEVQISLQPDGHYGLVDPLVHPQVLDERTRYPWMAAIQRPPPPTDPRAALWHIATKNDFKAAEKSAIPVLGLFSDEMFQTLQNLHAKTLDTIFRSRSIFGDNPEYKWMCMALTSAYARLSFPATFRDLVRQWACYRRATLYLLAWLHYYNGVTPFSVARVVDRLSLDSYMGCFTTSPNVVQKLMNVDIPVWFLRPSSSLASCHVVRDFCALEVPMKHLPISDDSIPSLTMELSGRMAAVVNIGDSHLEWIAHESSTYLDLERHPFPTITPRGLSAAISRRPELPLLRASAAQISPVLLSESDRKKFDMFAHPCIPTANQQWLKAMNDIDKFRRIPDSQVIGYFVPDARQLVNTTTEVRQKQFVCNWLRVQMPWGAALQSSGLYTIGPLKPSLWREYLNLSGTLEHMALAKKSSQLLQDVIVIFQNVFGTTALDLSGPATWLGTDASVVIDDEWQKLCRQVTWEVSEVAFRCELVELDRKIISSSTDPVLAGERAALIAKVFPPGRRLFLHEEFPSRAAGLNAPSYRQRAPYLDAFRQVISHWPDVPPILLLCQFVRMSPSQADLREYQMYKFYCQTFLNVCGRAPVIPRHIPI
ncbi:hypothetical protein NM688_g4139 [Phlebia brevispora]|uniref:Uncharacterized protein n=1 Tax=Phlebia brevispora TaxID=194682 RepID=A0ACC1T469_9APHY|nr:hypothetical protein NM688_g4139 [Phlebia brevispora]